MKKNPKGCACLSLLIGGGIVLLLAAIVYYFYIGPKILDHKRFLAGPPTILVRSPLAGDTVPPGSSMIAQAAVTGANPIARVEVWLDGQVVATQSPDTQNQTTVYVSIPLEIAAGTHMLFWRAVDNTGLVGQSAPTPIAGEFPPGAGDTTTVNANDGQSVEDIANAQGIDPGVLQNLNPNLGEGGLPGGTPVNVPVPPGQGNGAPQNAPNNAPTPPLPNTPSGIAALLPMTLPTIDLAPLIPGLLNNLPSAPSYLQAWFENCAIRLVWNDNATNESSFHVWMQALGGPPLLIETLHDRPGTGQTWFEFASPSFGIYSFWVEAVNALGAQSGEIVWVAVNDTNCGEGVASQLEIEALGMYGFGGGWDRIYCYLSIEGAPEQRVPEDDSQFLQKDLLGGADIHNWIGGKNRILMKMPIDEEVSLEGDCWGWLGDRPASMGEFGVSVPREHWDNRTLQARAANYVIDFRIRPFGSKDAAGAYQYRDYDLPRPYNLRVDVVAGDDPVQNAYWAQHPVVRWDWNGDPQSVTGFTLYVDGSIVDWNVVNGPVTQWDPALGKQALAPTLPTSCGGTYQFQVVANSGHAQSMPSDPVEYIQPPCQRYLIITYDSFSFSYLDDGELGDCDDPELEIDGFGNVGELEIECNKEYPFAGLLGDTPFEYILPIPPEKSHVTTGLYFYDHDFFIIDWGPQVICAYYHNIEFSDISDSEWQNLDQSFSVPCPSGIVYSGTFYGRGVVKYHVRGLLSPK